MTASHSLSQNTSECWLSEILKCLADINDVQKLGTEVVSVGLWHGNG